MVISDYLSLAVCEETNTRSRRRNRGKRSRDSQKGYSPGLIRHRAGRVTKVFTFPRFKGTGISRRPMACPSGRWVIPDYRDRIAAWPAKDTAAYIYGLLSIHSFP